MPTPAPSAPRSGLLTAGRLGNHAGHRAEVPGPPPCPVGAGGASPRFTSPASRRFTPEVPCVRIGCRTRPVSRPWLGNRRPFLHRLQTPMVADH